MSTLNNKYLILLIVIGSVVAAGYFMYNKYLEYETRIKRLEQETIKLRNIVYSFRRIPQQPQLSLHPFPKRPNDRTTEHLLPMAASALSQQRCQLRSIMVSLNNDVDVLPLAVPRGNIAPRQPLLNVR